MSFRRTLRVAAVVTAALVLVVALIAGLAHTGRVRRYVLGELRSTLAAGGVVLDASGLDYNLLNRRFTLFNLRLQSAAAPDLPAFFSAEEATLALNLTELVRGRIEVESAEIRRPEIHVVIGEDGGLNLPVPPAGADRVDWFVRSLTAAGASLIVEDRRVPFTVRLPSWDAAVRGEDGRREILTLTTNRAGSLAQGDTLLPMDSVIAEIAMTNADGSIEVRSLHVGSGATGLEVKGSIRNPEDPVVDLAATGDLALETLAPFFPPDLRTEIRSATPLRVQATARGPLAQPVLNGQVEGDAVVLPYLEESAIQARGSYDLAASRLHVDSMSVRSLLLSSTGDADLDLSSERAVNRVNLQAQTVDLERLSRLVRLPLPVKGDLAGTFNLSWPGRSIRTLSGSGAIQLRGVSAEQGQLRIADLGGPVNLSIRNGDVSARTTSLSAPGVRIAGDVEVSRQNALRGDVLIEDADIAKLVMNSPVSGLVSAQASLSGTTAAPLVEARISAPALSYGSIAGAQLEASGRYETGVISIDTSSVVWQGQRLQAQGRIDLNTPSPALNIAVEVPGADLRSLLAGVPGANVDADGQVKAVAAVSGDLAAPRVQLQVNADGLELWDRPLGVLSAEAHLDKGTLTLDNLVLNPQEGELRATGSLDIATRTYNVNLEGRGLMPGEFLPAEAFPARGTLSFEGNSRGTFNDPQAMLQVQLAGLQFQNREYGDVRGTVALSNRLAVVHATLPSLAAELDAEVEIDSPFPAEFELRTSGVDIAQLPFENVAEWSGKIAATIQGRADLETRTAVNLTAQVEPLNLQWMGHAVTSDGPIMADLANDVVRVRDVTIKVVDSTVRLAGSIPLKETAPGGDFTVDLEAKLANLLSLLPMNSDDAAAIPVAEGTLSVHASLRGHPKAIDASGNIRVVGAAISTPALPVPLTDINLEASLANGDLNIDRLTGKWGTALIDGGGTFPLSLISASLPLAAGKPREPGHFALNVRDFKLSSLPGTPEDVEGWITARIEGDAASGDLQDLTAVVSFTDLRVLAGNFEVRQAGTSTVDLSGGTLTVRRFELTGDQTSLRLAGTVNVAQPVSGDLLLEGTTDASILRLFARELAISGSTAIRLTAQGDARNPKVAGFLEMNDGQFFLPEPRVNVEGLNVRLDVSNNQLQVTRLEGEVNGGAMTGEGRAVISGSGIESLQMSVKSVGTYLEFPEGVRTVSNADIRVAGGWAAINLSGDIDILEGDYDEPRSIERSLLEYFTNRSATAVVTDDDPTLEKVRLNVSIRTLTPLAVDTEFATGSVTADLQLQGTAAQPGLTGRIVVEQGAELYLRERRYIVDRGVISFANDREIQPLADISAQTKASGYDVTMLIQSDSTGRIDTTLTSEPPLPEPDIISILATGRTLAEAQEAGIEVAREQVLSYLAGGIGGELTQQASRLVGLSQLQIEPSLIAPEAEPTARLTFGKRITPELNFVYSMNLRDSSDYIWIAEYDVSRRFSTRTLRQNDNTYRFQFQHRLSFGLPEDDTVQQSGTTTPRKIGSIRFNGETQFSESELRKTADLKTGDSYDFFKSRQAIDRLRERFASAGFLEARLSLTRTERDAEVDLRFDLRPGPVVEIVYEGWDVSGATRQAVAQVWQSVPIDSLRLQDAAVPIETELAKEGYLRAGVEGQILAEAPGRRSVVFRIQPGLKHSGIEVVFEGAKSIPASELEELLDDAGYMARLHSTGAEAAAFLKRHYVSEGFLTATVAEPEYELNLDTGSGRFVFRHEEGPLFQLGPARFAGNSAFTEEVLLSKLDPITNSPAVASRLSDARSAIESFYHNEGFSEAVVRNRLELDQPRGVAGITFEIEEHQRRVLGNIQIEGNVKTSPGLIVSQIGLDMGDAVSGLRLAKARSNLYSTGVFSLVDLDVFNAQDQETPGIDVPVTITARVREVAPYELRYGAFFDTERGIGGITDFATRNLIGGARTAGVQARYDADLREVRGYFSQPSVRRLPVKSIGSVFFRREVETDFLTDRKGVSGNAEYQIGENNVVGVGFREEWVHTFDKVPQSIPFDVSFRVAPLTFSFARDTRDDRLDATSGRLLSDSMEWTPGFLGSDLRYIKNFVQYFQYLPLGKPTRVPWVNATRNRTVVALGARLGLVHGFDGQTIARSERFFAGGGTTVRGFEQDALGPLDFEGEPNGGNAVLTLNSEFRFPTFGFVDGVGFVDAGNVFSNIRDFKLWDLRPSAGVGLRIRTPYALIRVDYGVNLRPRLDEPRGKFFFSIGQAF